MPAQPDFDCLTDVSPVLTSEQLTAVLSKWFGQRVSFTHWEYVGGIGKGDSYLSEIMRIRIFGLSEDGTFKHVQVFLKYIPKSISRRLSFRSDEFFRNEVNFYNIILPSLLKFQSSKNVADPFTNCVNSFFAYTDGANDVICVEDATLQKFTSTCRQEAVDYDHCIIGIKALAKFHALSFAMRDQMPTEFDRIKNSISEILYADRLWDWYERFWDRICKVAIDAVEKEYPDTIYVKKIKEFAVPERYKDMVQAVKADETGVIAHGDCWSTNFLYKYENGHPVDAKILDFQLTRCASPVLDLTMFIHACTTQELRLKHYDDLLKYYYLILSKQIKEMGSNPKKIYSWEKFMEEIRKYSYFGLVFSFEATPLVVLPPENAFNMDLEGDKIVNIGDVFEIQPFKTREARLREADNVVFCVDRGYI